MGHANLRLCYIRSEKMSLGMRKPVFGICENKDADQLHSNCAADQPLCFCYMDSTIIRNFKTLAIFYGSTARCVSEMVGNPKDRFSSVAALLLVNDITWDMLIRE